MSHYTPASGCSKEQFTVLCPELAEKQLVFLGSALHPNFPWPQILVPLSLLFATGAMAPLACGRILVAQGQPLFRIISRELLPPSVLSPLAAAAPHALSGYFAITLKAIAAGNHTLLAERNGISLAWITLSDKGAQGLRQDESGPVIEETLKAFPLLLGHTQGFILPDSPEQLQALLANLAHLQGYDLIITTGGTGVGPRDTTPEAVLPLLSLRLPGFEQAMMTASLTKTPYAMVSRALAGAIGQSLVLCLPGSKKAVRENLDAIIPALAHTISKLQGDTSDCAHPA